MAHLKPTPREIAALREDAWIGDAVLELYVRTWVLKEKKGVDSPTKIRFTRNSFLNCFDQPTRAEAKIGVVYKEQGLEKAFTWIRENIEPLFLKQEANRKRSHRS